MILRVLNILVIGALVTAAAYVYKIKFESTREAERVAKLRMEIRQEQDQIAALRAQWSKLDSPARIQELANRHLQLRPITPRQFDKLDTLPERPPDLVPLDADDPIGILLDNPALLEIPTASIPKSGSKSVSKSGRKSDSRSVPKPSFKSGLTSDSKR